MADQADIVDFGQAVEISGELASHANAIQLFVLRSSGERTTIEIPAADLQRLVPLLLLLGRSLPTAPSDPAVGKLSLVPADSLSVGELPSGDTMLAISVGAATVGFSIPTAAAGALGRSLLLASMSTSVQ